MGQFRLGHDSALMSAGVTMPIAVVSGFALELFIAWMFGMLYCGLHSKSERLEMRAFAIANTFHSASPIFGGLVLFLPGRKYRSMHRQEAAGPAGKRIKNQLPSGDLPPCNTHGKMRETAWFSGRPRASRRTGSDRISGESGASASPAMARAASRKGRARKRDLQRAFDRGE